MLRGSVNHNAFKFSKHIAGSTTRNVKFCSNTLWVVEPAMYFLKIFTLRVVEPAMYIFKIFWLAGSTTRNAILKFF